LPCRLAFSDSPCQVLSSILVGSSILHSSQEVVCGLDPGELINFKNAGNGGFFNVFEVPQMENGWKMENGLITLGYC
jgi:hypothetical protein